VYGSPLTSSCKETLEGGRLEGRGGGGVVIDMTRLDCGHLLQRTSFLDLF
jgi:hypothetical protein